jgi:hypothetical protein
MLSIADEGGWRRNLRLRQRFCNSSSQARESQNSSLERFSKAVMSQDRVRKGSDDGKNGIPERNKLCTVENLVSLRLAAF